MDDLGDTSILRNHHLLGISCLILFVIFDTMVGYDSWYQLRSFNEDQSVLTIFPGFDLLYVPICAGFTSVSWLTHPLSMIDLTITGHYQAVSATIFPMTLGCSVHSY